TEDSVLVKAGQHIRLQAGATITLTAGEGASITLTSDGKVEIRGKNGLIELSELLDLYGVPIQLNCSGAAPE
ncbi:hypothetical protein C8234_05875, partial [Paracidovorax avenae]